MNATEKRVLDSVDLEELTKLTSELVAIPSYGGKESRAQRFMAERLHTLGFKVDTWAMDFGELRKHPDFSMSISRDEGLGVVGTTGEGDRSLILCGHIDTVDPGDPANWATDPLKATVKDGQLYGRGVCDMKGGIAAALIAAKAIMDAGAYGFSMSSQYNSRPRAAEVMVLGGEARLVRSRESLEDLARGMP